MSRMFTKEEDDFLRESFKKLSHLEVGLHLGRTTKSVRNRYWRLGIVDVSDNWTPAQIEALKALYEDYQYNEDGRVQKFAMQIGKSDSNVSRKARELGLTNKSRKFVRSPKIRKPKYSTAEDRLKAMSESTKRWISEKGHPRGALGMQHSEESKKIIAEKNRRWYESLTEYEKEEISLKAMRTRVKNGSGVVERPKASWKSGWRQIGGVNKYFRSRWEANYARYLENLKKNGEILDWLHEAETFWFEGIRRGCVSYLPDFKVTKANGDVEYHEVKGWMDDRSKTKIKRMAKYHPDVVLKVIREKEYMEIEKSVGAKIAEWEFKIKGKAA